LSETIWSHPVLIDQFTPGSLGVQIDQDATEVEHNRFGRAKSGVKSLHET
jgi:hypothetical protein